jgi:hypothetical protein
MQPKLLNQTRLLANLMTKGVSKSLTRSGRIDVIRLGSSRPPIHLHARRIDHVAAHALAFEQTVEPEPVIARLVA